MFEWFKRQPIFADKFRRHSFYVILVTFLSTFLVISMFDYSFALLKDQSIQSKLDDAYMSMERSRDSFNDLLDVMPNATETDKIDAFIQIVAEKVRLGKTGIPILIDKNDVFVTTSMASAERKGKTLQSIIDSESCSKECKTELVRLQKILALKMDLKAIIKTSIRIDGYKYFPMWVIIPSENASNKTYILAGSVKEEELLDGLDTFHHIHFFLQWGMILILWLKAFYIVYLNRNVLQQQSS